MPRSAEYKLGEFRSILSLDLLLDLLGTEGGRGLQDF